MKISLIQPKFPPHIDIILAPLNLGYIASYLKSKGVEEVSVYSAILEKNILDKIKDCDLVGVSVNTAVLRHANYLTNEIKKRNPKAIIVWGGAYPTALPEGTLKNENVDFVVRGEGEVTFYKLIEKLQKNETLKDVAGISYKENGGFYHAENRKLIKELDKLPFPDRNLMSQSQFLDIWSELHGERSLLVVSSRGCPYRCIHCSSSNVWTRKWRPRSAENIIKELKYLIEHYKIDVIGFGDSVFGVDKRRVKKFCELYKKEELEVPWWCQDNIKHLDKELLITMKEAKCRGIAVGVESGSSKILTELKKDVSINKMKKVFKEAKKLDFTLSANFMIGAPSEDYNTIQKSEKLFHEIAPESCGISIVIPFPGSELYDHYKKGGKFKNGVDWSSVRYDKALVGTKKLTKAEINREYRRLYKKMYALDLGAMNFKHLIKKGIRELFNVPFSEYSFILFKSYRYIKLFIHKKIEKIT